MKAFRTVVLMILCTSPVFLSTGCAVLHELKPHRLHRLNRYEPQPDPGAMFSVPDPVPAAADRDG